MVQRQRMIPPNRLALVANSPTRALEDKCVLRLYGAGTDTLTRLPPRG